MQNFATTHYAFEIELLRTFQAVVRFGQFLAAASFLNRSPSAVSVHIKRLEELAGGRLLERDNQTVTLTPLGRRFALQSAELLAVHDRMLASYARTSAQGRVRVGISDEFAEQLLGGVLAPLAAEYPDIELEVLTGSSGRLKTRLARGQLDLALIVEPVGLQGSGAEPLEYFGTTEPVWVAAHNFNVDADKPVPLALYGKGCPYRSMAVDTLARLGKSWRTVLMSASMTALETAICAGLAVGVIDRERVSPRMRVLVAEEGFPPMTPHHVQLIGAPGEASDAVQAVTRLTREHFRR
ncbi:LysR family transcriptional regulator [Pseudomonas sp. R1-18]|uniref:LysR substrate-binding domain-containing protein n=1 Tax=Pseudomonas sp. R1-18 TaxID=1632772 RepID=UPI003DA9A579